ncbi:MAG: hypothetical protein GY854_12665 [Deltaproteobacteria bacterium]|nr:hypothetical protein [Deltaproteobacteria bacterium]
MFGTKIQDILTRLETLLDEVGQLRQRYVNLEKNLHRAERDYDSIIGLLNAEADRLRACVRTLTARLAHRPQTHIDPGPTLDTTVPASPPTPDEVPAGDDSYPLETAPCFEPSLAADKRSLADHIEYFVQPADREWVMGVLNAVLVNDQKGVGEMLELVEWGDIWTARAEWESSEDQYRRLVEWRAALADRLEYWQSEFHRLENDPRYDLLVKMREKDRADWLRELEQLARDQEKENEILAQKVADLERAWQTRELGVGSNS